MLVRAPVYTLFPCFTSEYLSAQYARFSHQLPLSKQTIFIFGFVSHILIYSFCKYAGQQPPGVEKVSIALAGFHVS